MFIILVAVYDCSAPRRPGAIGWAIIVLTLVVRTVVIPLYRAPDRRRSAGCSSSQPEIKEIQRRYKGDRVKAQGRPAGAATRSAASARSPAACPLLLQMPLLFIMYSVIQRRA